MKPIFGITSVVCFCISVACILLFAPLFFLLSLVGSVSAIVSLCTEERPRCFGYVGLLNIWPILLFCYHIGGVLLGAWEFMPAQN